MTITSLVDDYCPMRGMQGEHGLSLYIETGHAKLLFDTGQSGVFLENARFLGIELSDLDAVILSHGHYDHGGGLGALYEALDANPPPLFAGKGFDAPRRARGKDGLTDIGLATPVLRACAQTAIILDAFEELSPRVLFLPHSERIDGTEPHPRFRRLQGGHDLVDEFDDEISLVFNEEDGIVVMTGCAHRGIANIARAAILAFPGRPVKALVGGFHFVDASDEALGEAIGAIAELAPTTILCSHCTGLRGYAALLAAMPGKAIWLSCGMRVVL